MPSRRRAQFSFGELIIRLVGLGFMMLVMFCFLPGGGGAKAVSALFSIAFSVIIFIFVVAIIGLIGFAVWAKIRRSKSEHAAPATWTPNVPPNYTLRTETSSTVEKPVGLISAPAGAAPISLAEQIRKIDWYQFEKVVALTYRKLGYSVESRGGAKADGGIDLIIQKGGEPIAVQCKHWQNWDIKVKTVREFIGALKDGGFKTGIFVTLNGYSGDAKQLAERNNIAIVNESRLVQMLEQLNARFDPAFYELLNDTRKLCPECESEMVVRTTKRGPNAGRKFWGCSSFPKCYYQMAFRTN